MPFFRRRRDEDASPDARVLAQLRAHGADVSRPRDANFYLYVRTREDAEDAAAVVRAEGYAANVTESAAEPPTEHPLLVLANRELVVDEESVAAARTLFERLAQRYSGDYDGWEAAID